MKKIILLALTALMVGCDLAMESLDIVNGSKFVVTSKTKDEQTYWYHVIKVGGDSWYDYHYEDTTNFNVGDTLVITVRRVGN